MKNTSIRVDDDVWEWLCGLPGRSFNDKVRGLMTAEAARPEPSDSGGNLALQVAELLELVRDLPDASDVELIVDTVMQRKIEERTGARTAQGLDPRAIPGVRPRRESERVAREAREAVARVQALDPVDDPDICRDPEFISG